MEPQVFQAQRVCIAFLICPSVYKLKLNCQVKTYSCTCDLTVGFTWSIETERASHSVMLDSLRPHGLYSPWNELSRPEYWSGQPFPSPGDLPNPGIEPRSPALQVDALPAEPPGKPKSTGVGSLFLLQWIFQPRN